MPPFRQSDLGILQLRLHLLVFFLRLLELLLQRLELIEQLLGFGLQVLLTGLLGSQPLDATDKVQQYQASV